MPDDVKRSSSGDLHLPKTTSRPFRPPGELTRIASADLVMKGLPRHVIKLVDVFRASRFTPENSYAIYDYGPGDTWYICEMSSTVE